MCDTVRRAKPQTQTTRDDWFDLVGADGYISIFMLSGACVCVRERCHGKFPLSKYQKDFKKPKVFSGTFVKKQTAPADRPSTRERSKRLLPKMKPFD